MHTYAVFTVSFYKSSHLRVNLKVGHVCTELLMPVHGQWKVKWLQNEGIAICIYVHTYIHMYIHTYTGWKTDFDGQQLD